jgi:ribonuclease HI
LTYHISYTDGASRWTWNLASATWALYTPSHALPHSNGICLGSFTNNQEEHTTVIGLLVKASHRHLSVFLDSQLVILQLNNVDYVRDPCLFRKYLQFRLLSRTFDSITFTHIPRQFNQIVDNMDNLVLDWHLSHQEIITVGTGVDPGFSSNSAPTSPNYWPFWQHLRSRCSLTRSSNRGVVGHKCLQPEEMQVESRQSHKDIRLFFPNINLLRTVIDQI